MARTSLLNVGSLILLGLATVARSGASGSAAAYDLVALCEVAGRPIGKADGHVEVRYLGLEIFAGETRGDALTVLHSDVPPATRNSLMIGERFIILARHGGSPHGDQWTAGSPLRATTAAVDAMRRWSAPSDVRQQRDVGEVLAEVAGDATFAPRGERPQVPAPLQADSSVKAAIPQAPPAASAKSTSSALTVTAGELPPTPSARGESAGSEPRLAPVPVVAETIAPSPTETVVVRIEPPPVSFAPEANLASRSPTPPRDEPLRGVTPDVSVSVRAPRTRWLTKAPGLLPAPPRQPPLGPPLALRSDLRVSGNPYRESRL